MCRYIGNVASNPGEDKFRRIRISNAAFQSKVASVPHSTEFLEIVGFKVSSVHAADHCSDKASDTLRMRRRKLPYVRCNCRQHIDSLSKVGCSCAVTHDTHARSVLAACCLLVVSAGDRLHVLWLHCTCHRLMPPESSWRSQILSPPS